MATPNVGILTTDGKALIDKVNSGQAKISFSKIVFSSMDNSQLSDMQVKALTAIAPQEVVVSSPETTLDTNSGETRIRATGTNEALTDGVYVKTYAVYAKDDSGNEILYGITVSPNPNYLPEYDGVTPQAVTYSYKVNISNTSNITFTNSNDIYVSDTDLAEAIQPYAKTVDVNQQLDNKVNITDMRKPASDVAGIEEVSAKQDKIGYTPADDSKVVHTSDTSNWQKQAMFNSGDFKIDRTTSTVDFSTLLRTKYNKAGVVYIRDNDWPTNASPVDAVVICEGMGWWYAYGVTPKNQFVHRRLRESDDTGWIINADDSKVAHLSGANNFDTIPTVNNNPLLLASSLPSDLARTSQQTNFTAGLRSGGVDVATAADLKSVKDSAWRVLDNKYITAFTKYNTSIKVDDDSLLLVKIDKVNKRVYMFFTILGNFVTNSRIYIDLTSIVKNVSFPNYYLYDLWAELERDKIYGSISGNRICFNIGSSSDTTVLSSIFSDYMVNAGEADWTYSSCFVNYDELV
ncbi:hypothetical protein [Levilactobacillus brevis]|uniref:hypothetical protein n=1 Tax=Levilactobacillus brevis TaxID=1580 RepID=UPI001F335BAA|nr:hypothetical protein [Levilactobacillus brevis]MCE6033407.1 hypothetical protein [Levilactobacillus brevis]